MEGIPERILCNSRTLADATNLLKHSNMESRLLALRVANLRSNTATQAYQDVALNVLEEESEYESDMSEDDYILDYQTVHETPVDIPHMIKAALNVDEESKLDVLLTIP